MSSVWVRLFVVSLALAGLVTGVLFVLNLQGRGPEVPALGGPAPVSVPVEIARTPVIMPALTHDASERQRIAAEHAVLLTSLPPPRGPEPTLTVKEEQRSVGLLIVDNPGGVPVPTRELEGWFDPDLGLGFWRETGGDWTDQDVRASHPYAPLFYYEEYPSDVMNFADGSMRERLARELAYAASEVMEDLGEPTPRVVQAFARRLGWELRRGDEPVINVWTTFEFRSARALHVYAVGGLLRMEVVSRAAGPGESSGVEFLRPGVFVGPVVVERLETRVE